MQNKQLERQLRSIIQGLKASEVGSLVEILQRDEGLFLNKNFTKSGVNCTCCTLTHDKLIATGFGRNQQQALINATKNYLETLVSTNSMIPELKNALKLKEASPAQPSAQVQPHRKEKQVDETLDLQVLREMVDLSAIQDEQGQGQAGCSCIYYEVHEHHMSEIRNMEARMKLIIKENQMLKQLLLKDARRVGQKYTDRREKENKENINVNMRPIETFTTKAGERDLHQPITNDIMQ